MAKYKFLHDRIGFTAGTVIEEDQISEGVLQTLLSFKVIKRVGNAKPKLDAKKDGKSDKPSSEPSGGEGSPEDLGDGAGQSS